LAVTKEKVLSHLTKRPTSLQTVLDKTRKLNELFYHQFMPHTVLIGQNGNVKAITTPDQVNAVVIQRMLP